jgi:hypothetical protein
MPSRRLIGMTALVGVAFAAGVDPAAARTRRPAGADSWRSVAAPAIALGAWILLTPAMFSGTVLAAASGLALGAIGGAALSVVGPWLVGSLPSRWHEPRTHAARGDRRASRQVEERPCLA